MRTFEELKAQRDSTGLGQLSAAEVKTIMDVDKNLYGADLYRANLYEANLREANLREADLGNANLYRADLRGADLRGAGLRGANLLEANLGDNRHIRQLGPIGSGKAYLIVLWDKGDVTIRRGCFTGDLEAFKAAVAQKPDGDPHRLEYEAVIVYLETVFTQWQAAMESK